MTAVSPQLPGLADRDSPPPSNGAMGSPGIETGGRKQLEMDEIQGLPTLPDTPTPEPFPFSNLEEVDKQALVRPVASASGPPSGPPGDADASTSKPPALLVQYRSLSDYLKAAITPGMKAQSEFDPPVRMLNHVLLGLSCLSIILMIIWLEAAWLKETTLASATNLTLAAAQATASSCDNLIMSLLSLNTGLTAVMLLVVAYYYAVQLDLERRRFFLTTSLPLWQSGFFANFLIEAFIVVLHPPPGIDYGDFHLMEGLSLLMFVRAVPSFMRVVRDNSAIYSDRKGLLDAVERTDFRLEANQFDWYLSIKAVHRSRNFEFVVVFTALLILIVAYSVHVAERSTQEAFVGFGNAVWFTVVTMTTVGYGDRSPSTHLGRFIAMIGSLGGIVVVSLFIASVTALFDMSGDESWAIGQTNLKVFREKETHLAIKYLQNAWRRYALAKKTATSEYDRKLFDIVDGDTSPERSLTPAARKKKLDPFFAREAFLVSKVRSARALREDQEKNNISEQDYMISKIQLVNERVESMQKKVHEALIRSNFEYGELHGSDRTLHR